MSSKQEKICEILVDSLVKSGDPLHVRVAGLSIDTVTQTVFKGYRKSSGAGLQLTDEGLDLMSRAFKVAEVSVEHPYPETPLMILLMEKNTKLPYHFTYSRGFLVKISLFDHDAAFILTLNAGDICQSFSMF